MAPEEGMLLWARPDGAAGPGSVELLRAAVREFNLGVHCCTYGELPELIRTRRCELVGIALDAETALVDLDLQRGDVAAFLNLTPVNSLAALASAAGTVDEIFLAGTLTRHPSGLFLLPAPSEIEEADAIGHNEVEVALRLLRPQFRYAVVDTSRTITGPALAAFEQSDRLLMLTDLSVPGVRAARRIV